VPASQLDTVGRKMTLKSGKREQDKLGTKMPARPMDRRSAMQRQRQRKRTLSLPEATIRRKREPLMISEKAGRLANRDNRAA